MVAIRPRQTKRRGTVYDIDYYDMTGKRRLITCYTKSEAQRLAAEKDRRPGPDPRMKFATLVEKWLTVSRGRVKPASYVQYERMAHKHLLPDIGHLVASRINRVRLEELASVKLEKGYTKTFVTKLLTMISCVAGVGIEEGVLVANPARGLRKLYKPTEEAQPDRVKALTPEELAALLSAAKAKGPSMYTLLLLMARTGIRVGETIALKWDDLDFAKRAITVARTVSNGDIGSTKSGKIRKVDMSAGLATALQDFRTVMRERQLKYGWGRLPEWIFVCDKGERISYDVPLNRFRSLVKAAGIRRRVSPHSLRHTFAALHVKRGTNIVYIQKQLGHSKISITVDLYGHWFSNSDLEAADALDAFG